ncbi:unnamed protein product, partial [Choristocarpus tenellus]
MGDPEDHLHLLELLGEGAYGAVYRAERRDNHEEVAVKIIPVDSNAENFCNEVDIMLGCTSPYTMGLHDCYLKARGLRIAQQLLRSALQDNEIWLVMEYAGGGSVSDIMEACGATLSEEETKECVVWMALALEYLHSNRKLHRDVKAGNVLLTLDGKAKLADFGVSKEINSMATGAQTAIGTPYWMAPEV